MARVDPYKNFLFLVEIDGITQAGFADCSGFSLTSKWSSTAATHGTQAAA